MKFKFAQFIFYVTPATLKNPTFQVLYNNNMGSMCHVRGVMQHTTKHDFLVSRHSSGSKLTF